MRRGSSVLTYGWLFVAACWIAVTIRLYHSYVFEVGYGRIWGVSDDVYIAADFARTWAEGGGLRWYPGAPKIEGFTSPLWVVLLAAVHLMPGFSPNHLGLYVLALNSALLALLAFLIFAALRKFTPADVDPSAPGNWKISAVLILIAAGGLSFCFWLSQGFEICLVAVIAMAVFCETLQARIHWPRVGLLLGIAFWARMDAVLYCTAALWCALGIHGLKNTRSMAIGLAVAATTAAALMLGRHAYYGEWLPNTYYLKATGWPLSSRLDVGWAQNATSLVIIAAGAIGFLLLRPMQHGIHGRLMVAVTGAFATELAAMAYSTFVGGDAWFQIFGYDRFGATALPFLTFAVSAVVLFGKWSPRQIPAVLVWAVALLVSPAFVGPGWDSDLPRRALSIDEPVLPRGLEGLWVRAGFLLGEITAPGTRIALCPAGAVIYFSRRGGVDVLGKIEPYVAKLPVSTTPPPEARCWWPRAGHNKEDVAGLFALRSPDVSIVEPPLALRDRYVAFKYRGPTFYALRNSPLITWSKVQLLEQ